MVRDWDMIDGSMGEQTDLCQAASRNDRCSALRREQRGSYADIDRGKREDWVRDNSEGNESGWSGRASLTTRPN